MEKCIHLEDPFRKTFLLAKVEFFPIYLFMIFFILLDRLKYLSTELKPFCKMHPG